MRKIAQNSNQRHGKSITWQIAIKQSINANDEQNQCY